MNSIRLRLGVWLLGGLLLFFAACAAGFYACTRKALVGAFDSTLAIEARNLASMVEWDEGKIECEFAPDEFSDFASPRQGAFFQMWLEDGTTLLRSPSLGKHSLLHRMKKNARFPKYWNLELPGDRDGRAILIQFSPKMGAEKDENPPKGEDPPVVLLAVARDWSRISQTLDTLFLALLAWGVVLLAGTGILVWMSVRRGLRPLDEVAARAAQINAATLEMRFPTAAMPVELRPICEKLNDLLARLEESFRRERRFTSDAAHELRTPIAELRTMAEVALKFPGGAEAGERALREALEIAEQMERLVGALLAIARCESGRQVPSLARVDVGELIRESWKVFGEQARARRLDVAQEIARPLDVETDAAMVSSILANLMSNAAEYTPEKGRIEIRAARRSRENEGEEEGAIEVVISNTCDSLLPEDIQHIFEPFWRKDAARSDSAHSGLGLAVAAAFARQLGIRMEAHLVGERRILQVSLIFPACAEPPAPDSAALGGMEDAEKPKIGEI